MPDESPRYTAEQMALILQRAAELQAWRESGLVSLGEIRAIAAEVGIPPDAVEEAARSLAVTGAGLPSGPTRSSAGPVELSIDHPLGPDDLSRLVDAVRRVTGTTGNAREVLRGVEWRRGGDSELVDLRVAITTTAGGARVHIEHDAGGVVVLAGIPVALGSLLTIMATFEGLALGPWLAGAAGILATGSGATWLLNRFIRERSAALVGRIAAAIRDEAARLPAPSPSPAGERGPGSA